MALNTLVEEIEKQHREFLSKRMNRIFETVHIVQMTKPRTHSEVTFVAKNRYQDLVQELNNSKTMEERLQVASACFDDLIQEFRVHAPILSQLKQVYHEVTQKYVEEIKQISILKHKIILSLENQASREEEVQNLKEKLKFLLYENQNLRNSE